MHGRSGPANTQCTVEVARTSARAHSEWRGNRTRSKWTVQAQARILSSGEAAHGRSGPYMRNRAKTQCTVEVDRLILSVRSKWTVQAHARNLSGGETAHGRSGPYRRNRAKTQCTVEVDRQQVCVGRQHGSREGCPDGWRGALHRVHEALPRGRLSEAC